MLYDVSQIIPSIQLRYACVSVLVWSVVNLMKIKVAVIPNTFDIRNDIETVYLIYFIL